MTRKTIAVDWDGTLVEYENYNGPGNFGSPVPWMVQRIKKWIAQGHEVIIFTSRVSVEWDAAKVMQELEAIDNKLTKLGLPLLLVTANKYSRISEFWDDRAVRVERNKGKVDHGFQE